MRFLNLEISAFCFKYRSMLDLYLKYNGDLKNIAIFEPYLKKDAHLVRMVKKPSNVMKIRTNPHHKQKD
jgi:hypothetical protein